MINEILNNFKLEKPKKTVWGNYRIDLEKGELIWLTSSKTEKSFSAAFSYEWPENYNKLSKEEQQVFDKEEEKLKNAAKSKAKNEAEKFCKEVKGEIKEYWNDFKVIYDQKLIDVIAKKFKNDKGEIVFLGNSSILSLIGRKVAYGRETLNRNETEIQRAMNSNNFTMIPFSVFNEAKLDLTKFESIQKEKDRKIKVKRFYRWNRKEFIIESRHFTGAHLFELDGQTYLFDLDRREIKHKIFNPFLVRLKKRVSTIKEAYELLKPNDVKGALKKGLDVKRQGEWFFIPCKGPKLKKLTLAEKISMGFSDFNVVGLTKSEIKKFGKIRSKTLKIAPIPSMLIIGENRPNSVEFAIKQNKKTFVKGVVSHDGREHADLNLKEQWHYAIPNTSAATFLPSFTLSGNID